MREVLLLDPGWRFHLGDISAELPNTHIAAYMNNKAGWARGAAKPNFDDSDWREVDLPHDWSVEGPFDPGSHVSQGFLPRGIGWYRRYFTLDQADRGKYIALRFDGVATHATVYVNGHLLARNFCGYTPIDIDISDIANFGEQNNVIAVKAGATYMEGWWYEGAGIYRHAWLIKTSPVHVDTYGTFICPRKNGGDSWDTQIQTAMVNTSDAEQSARVACEIQNSAGQIVGRGEKEISIAGRSKQTVEQNIPVAAVQLWSLENPTLHRLHTQIFIGSAAVDDDWTAFGYRTIRFDAQQGFFLNDRPVKLEGTCNHQDHAGVGVAVPDSIQRFRIRRMLEMGSNAWRCAHNPPATEFLDACDELGMLVIDENRNFGSSPEHLEQVRTMVRRDRNHPSVILWSVCNEEATQGTPIGANIARTMQEEVRKLDRSRPVTAAVSGGILNHDCIGDVIEVMGINYQSPTYDPYHALRPLTPLIASETSCALGTRGVYQTDAKARVFASYDIDHAFWSSTARAAWAAVSQRPFVAGLFIWTGFDYRGEPSPHEWPCVSSHWGILDTCGFAKDSFFLHKAFFTTEPFVHLLPHWNWTTPTTVRVMAYTNCESVELFLDGTSLGEKPVDPIEMVEWSVEFSPGELRAVAFRAERAVADCAVETTGPATALGLEIHPSMDARTIPADGRFALPITVFAVDQRGRRVPTAGYGVDFSIDGPAKILGVGNGDPNSHEGDKGNSRSLFNGLAQAIVQTTTTAGKIRLGASAAGLRAAEFILESTAVPSTPTAAIPIVRHLISEWRMSPITSNRPDPTQPPSEQDMNSWERISPSADGQARWNSASGFAVYRAHFTLPKIMQSHGAQIHFHQIRGAAEVFVDGRPMQVASSRIAVPPGSERQTLVVLIHAQAAGSGITGPVELLSL